VIPQSTRVLAAIGFGAVKPKREAARVVVDRRGRGPVLTHRGDVGVHHLVREGARRRALHHPLEVEARADEALREERELEEEHVPRSYRSG